MYTATLLQCSYRTLKAVIFTRKIRKVELEKEQSRDRRLLKLTANKGETRTRYLNLHKAVSARRKELMVINRSIYKFYQFCEENGFDPY